MDEPTSPPSLASPLTAEQHQMITERAAQDYDRAMKEDPKEFRPPGDPIWTLLAARSLRSEGKIPPRA